MGRTIEQTYHDAFSSNRVDPPPGTWEKIEQTLADNQVEVLYRSTFSNQAETVPAGMWFKIRQQLLVQQFTGLISSRVAIYCTAVVGLVGSALWYYWASAPGAPSPATSTTQSISPRVTTQAKNAVKQTTTGQSNTPASEPEKTKTSSTTQAVKQVAVLSQKPSNTYDEHNQAKVITDERYIIKGDSVICAATQHYYELHAPGVINAGIMWKTSSQDISVINLSTEKVAIRAEKTGRYDIIVEIARAEGTIVRVTKHVTIIVPAVLTIKGDNSFCEGASETYTTNEKQPGSVSFTWSTRSNPYSTKAREYATIDWKTTGYDTVTVSCTGLTTGCVSTARLPVIIYPKPEPDFRTTNNGNGEIGFHNTSQCGKKSVGCKLTCHWWIDDKEYTTNDVRVYFKESGIYPVSLDVKNDFGCKASYKQDINVDIYNLFVPNAFIAGKDEFIPSGENLETFRIEIFNSSGKKMWESTQLTDGKPSEGWNGTCNGTMQPKGIYSWKIEASFKDGTRWKGVYSHGEYQTHGTLFMIE